MKSEKDIWKALETVMDPEIPVLSVVDLGIITDVKIENEKAEIKMTPTFTACPAIKLMEKQIYEAVKNIGFETVDVETNFDVSWNSNRISEKGKKIIKNFGLAPPPKHDGNPDLSMIEQSNCPHCDSKNTTMKTPFGPTLCRSMHYCYDCLEAFEQFKPI